MTKKNIFLLGLLVVIAAAWLIFFRNPPAKIQIMHNVHGPRRRAGNFNAATGPILTFGFDREYELTDISVVQASALKTNDTPVPVWHLVSESNSIPVKTIFYGQWVRGMKAAMGTRPQALHQNESYRLSLKAVTGETGDYEFKAP